MSDHKYDPSEPATLVKNHLGAGLLAIALTLFTACSSESGDENAPDTENEAMSTEAQIELTVEQNAPYGKYLANGEGRPLYLFTADSQGHSSSCYETCAQRWPPVLAPGSAADSAVKSSMIGTIQRENGESQLTYNGWPLYYFTKDSASDNITGQDVHSFGGEWYLVSPQGTKVEAES